MYSNSGFALQSTHGHLLTPHFFAGTLLHGVDEPFMDDNLTSLRRDISKAIHKINEERDDEVLVRQDQELRRVSQNQTMADARARSILRTNSLLKAVQAKLAAMGCPDLTSLAMEDFNGKDARRMVERQQIVRARSAGPRRTGPAFTDLSSTLRGAGSRPNTSQGFRPATSHGTRYDSNSFAGVYSSFGGRPGSSLAMTHGSSGYSGFGKKRPGSSLGGYRGSPPPSVRSSYAGTPLNRTAPRSTARPALA